MHAIRKRGAYATPNLSEDAYGTYDLADKKCAAKGQIRHLGWLVRNCLGYDWDWFEADYCEVDLSNISQADVKALSKAKVDDAEEIHRRWQAEEAQYEDR